SFWTVERKVEVKRLDLRPQAVEITAQEMLTKDRIALRVTLTALRRIVDPQLAVAAVADIDAWLYRLVQFAIREAVAARPLDGVKRMPGPRAETMRYEMKGRPRAALRVCAGERRFASTSFDTGVDVRHRRVELI